MIKGEPEAKYTAAEVAAWLQRLSTDALKRLSQGAAPVPGQTHHTSSQKWRQMYLDVFVQAKMGMFFAEKLRAGLLWALFETTQKPIFADEALIRYRAARQAWAELAEKATGAYRDDITYGPAYFQHGHWKDRLAAID
jgi:hypothetical protein